MCAGCLCSIARDMSGSVFLVLRIPIESYRDKGPVPEAFCSHVCYPTDTNGRLRRSKLHSPGIRLLQLRSAATNGPYMCLMPRMPVAHDRSRQDSCSLLARQSQPAMCGWIRKHSRASCSMHLWPQCFLFATAPGRSQTRTSEDQNPLGCLAAQLLGASTVRYGSEAHDPAVQTMDLA